MCLNRSKTYIKYSLDWKTMWKRMSNWTKIESEDLPSMRADEEVSRPIAEIKDCLIYEKNK